MKKISSALAVCACSIFVSTARADAPAVTAVTLSQDASTQVATIRYTLQNAPAVVTLDLRDADGNSIGGTNMWHLSGDVNRLMPTNGDYTIEWRPLLEKWNGKVDSLKAVVTAWATNSPPDYMVVDVTTGTNVWFYAGVDCLPGGLLSNTAYRSTMIVMKYMNAAGVTWTMGGTVAEGHSVTLDYDYYIGVFEVTQGQWLVLTKGRTPNAYGLMRPMEKASYNEMRLAAPAGTAPAYDASYDYPHDPHPSSYLGLLRKRTGVAFDMPSEAQWEYACRAGQPNGYWNDGTPTSSQCPGRTKNIAERTADAGSYAQSLNGTYDMHGNVFEWCLDWQQAYSAAWEGIDKGVPNVNGGTTIDGTAGGNKVRRGGCYAFVSGANEMSGQRDGQAPNTSANYNGFRLACPAQPFLTK